MHHQESESSLELRPFCSALFPCEPGDAIGCVAGAVWVKPDSDIAFQLGAGERFVNGTRELVTVYAFESATVTSTVPALTNPVQSAWTAACNSVGQAWLLGRLAVSASRYYAF